MTSIPGRPQVRRRALIGAALAEIADRGSLDVTVAQIAARAGVSTALAHHYFGAKEDLILATMRHLLAEFSAGVAAELRQAESPRGRISGIVAGASPGRPARQAATPAGEAGRAWQPAAKRVARRRGWRRQR
jgi:AcrR family transcriptional regulator